MKCYTVPILYSLLAYVSHSHGSLPPSCLFLGTPFKFLTNCMCWLNQTYYSKTELNFRSHFQKTVHIKFFFLNWINVMLKQQKGFCFYRKNECGFCRLPEAETCSEAHEMRKPYCESTSYLGPSSGVSTLLPIRGNVLQ